MRLSPTISLKDGSHALIYRPFQWCWVTNRSHRHTWTQLIVLIRWNCLWISCHFKWRYICNSHSGHPSVSLLTQSAAPDPLRVQSVEQRLLELNRQSTAARSRLLELIEQQRQSVSDRVSPSVSPIPPPGFSPHPAGTERACLAAGLTGRIPIVMGKQENSGIWILCFPGMRSYGKWYKSKKLVVAGENKAWDFQIICSKIECMNWTQTLTCIGHGNCPFCYGIVNKKFLGTLNCG